jgi:hypothetical protein
MMKTSAGMMSKGVLVHNGNLAFRRAEATAGQQRSGVLRWGVERNPGPFQTLGGSCEMTHLSWHNKWRRLSSLRFRLVLIAFRRLEIAGFPACVSGLFSWPFAGWIAGWKATTV